ncbi:MAG: hypothetical protein JWR15_96, partial [Prosthecobacter sp.]|nr:hypothetical protein [Prosthecobacter sp.]
DDGPVGPTPAELLAHFRTQLESGTLSTTDKARMEMLLLRRWRDELALGSMPMDLALHAISRDAKTASALKTLQHWLHHPTSSVQSTEIAALLSPTSASQEVPA